MYSSSTDSDGDPSEEGILVAEVVEPVESGILDEHEGILTILSPSEFS